MRRRLIAVLLVGLGAAAAIAAQSAFGPAAGPSIGAGWVPVPAFVISWSRTLNATIARLSRDVAEGNIASSVPAFLAAFVFGVVHVIGPGHGKIFGVSLFLSRPSRARDGLVYSAIVSVVDSISAAFFVILAYVVLRGVAPSFRLSGPRLFQIVSYSVIVLLGAVHLATHLRGHRHHDHRPAAASGASPPVCSFALSVGLIPCPVSTVLIVYGLANRVLPFMALMVVAVSLGGFVTLSLLSLAVIRGRSAAVAGLRARGSGRIVSAIEYAASGAIIVTGAVLLLGVLGAG